MMSANGSRTERGLTPLPMRPMLPVVEDLIGTGVPMRTTRWLPFLLWLAAASATARPSTSVPPVNQPLVGPQAALERYAESFRDRSPDGISAVLTSDYRFHTVGDSLERFSFGSDRETEIGVVRNLLLGIKKNGVTVVPPPDSVSLWFDGISEGIDPEHPDSSQFYETLTVKRANLHIKLANGDHIYSDNTTHVFHVVRGDVAQLEPGQSAKADAWYIRRWLEDVSAVRAALAERQGGCGEEPSPTAGPSSTARTPVTAPTMLAVHALTNPACSKLEVACDLPGKEPAHVEVYDVSGRRVNQRDVQVANAGTMTIEAGRGAKIEPGVYWVRLGQGLRPPTTRMVVVAK